ncbi:MAG: hypothetical protein RR620_13190 [Clostridium sp.]
MGVGEIGTVIGKLTVLDRKREDKRTYCYCECECGSKTWIRADSLKTTKSCGCLAKETQFETKDLINKTFGRLTVIKATDKRDTNGSVIWECKCSCNNSKEVSSHNLERRGVRSCGCLSSEIHSKSINKAIKVHLEKNIVEGTNIQAISNSNLIASNTSGCTGVKWDKRRKLWLSEIQFKNKIYYLGRYKNKDDAIAIRKEAKEQYHKSFLEWYKKEYKKE